MQSTTATLQKHPKTAIKPRRSFGHVHEKGVPCPICNPNARKPDLGTPETALNARPDFINTVLASDVRTQGLAAAAAAICKAHDALWVRSKSRAATYEPRVDGRREAEDFSPAMRALVLKYHAWLDEIHRPSRRLSDEWINAMILDGMAPYEVDMRAIWPTGTAKGMLIEALEIYCRVKVPE